MSERVVSIADFEEARACPRETKLFVEHFGDGKEATFERVMGVALIFDWVFAARHMLTDRQQSYFRALIAADFRQIARGTDTNQEKRRRAMARAFYKAWNSKE